MTTPVLCEIPRDVICLILNMLDIFTLRNMYGINKFFRNLMRTAEFPLYYPTFRNYHPVWFYESKKYHATTISLGNDVQGIFPLKNNQIVVVRSDRRGQSSISIFENNKIIVQHDLDLKLSHGEMVYEVTLTELENKHLCFKWKINDWSFNDTPHFIVKMFDLRIQEIKNTSYIESNNETLFLKNGEKLKVDFKNSNEITEIKISESDTNKKVGEWSIPHVKINYIEHLSEIRGQKILVGVHCQQMLYRKWNEKLRSYAYVSKEYVEKNINNYVSKGYEETIVAGTLLFCLYLDLNKAHFLQITELNQSYVILKNNKILLKFNNFFRIHDILNISDFKISKSYKDFSNKIIFSNVNDIIIKASGEQIQIFKLTNNFYEPIHTIKCPSLITFMAVSRDGNIYTTHEDRMLRFWKFDEVFPVPIQNDNTQAITSELNPRYCLIQ